LFILRRQIYIIFQSLHAREWRIEKAESRKQKAESRMENLQMDQRLLAWGE
jgi:hypothetical protein